MCDDCARCKSCHLRLVPEDQWPCLACGRMLCGSCDCPTKHPEQDD